MFTGTGVPRQISKKGHQHRAGSLIGVRVIALYGDGAAGTGDAARRDGSVTSVNDGLEFFLVDNRVSIAENRQGAIG